MIAGGDDNAADEDNMWACKVDDGGHADGSYPNIPQNRMVFTSQPFNFMLNLWDLLALLAFDQHLVASISHHGHRSQRFCVQIVASNLWKFESLARHDHGHRSPHSTAVVSRRLERSAKTAGVTTWTSASPHVLTIWKLCQCSHPMSSFPSILLVFLFSSYSLFSSILSNIISLSLSLSSFYIPLLIYFLYSLYSSILSFYPLSSF